MTPTQRGGAQRSQMLGPYIRLRSNIKQLIMAPPLIGGGIKR